MRSLGDQNMCFKSIYWWCVVYAYLCDCTQYTHQWRSKLKTCDRMQEREQKKRTSFVVLRSLVESQLQADQTEIVCVLSEYDNRKNALINSSESSTGICSSLTESKNWYVPKWNYLFMKLLLKKKQWKWWVLFCNWSEIYGKRSWGIPLKIWLIYQPIILNFVKNPIFRSVIEVSHGNQ